MSLSNTNLVCCLLVSDDPDDHLEFTEALAEIDSEAILLTISDGARALRFLKSNAFMPAFIFLNTTDNDGLVEAFEKLIADEHWKSMTRLLTFNDADLFNRSFNFDTAQRNYSYDDLREMLRVIIGPL